MYRKERSTDTTVVTVTVRTPPHRSSRASDFVGMLALCLSVAACGSPFQTASPEVPPLVIQVGTALPPGVPGTGVPALINGLLGEPLVSPDRVGRMQPRLCESVEWLKDGRVLRLTLAPKVLFHDGTVLTSAVLADFLRARFAQRDQASYASVIHVDTPSDTLVDIHLSRPEAFLAEDLADFMVTLGPKGEIGTGPFMLDPTGGSKLRAFADYRRGRSEVDAVEIKAYPSLRGAWTAMMRGDINILYEVSRESADFVDVESSVRTYPFLRAYYYFVAFNVRHPVLGRREVRQALSSAIDRDAIVRDAMRRRGEAADGPIWKYHWAYSTTQRSYRHNLDAARLRLDAEGFRAPTSSAGPNMPSRFRFKCLILGNDARFEAIGLLLQKQLYDIGVDMEIEAVPLAPLVDRLKQGEFDAFLFEMNSGRMLTWLYRTWHSGAATVDTGYRSADVLLDRLRHATSETETRSIVADLQQVFYDDPPALFLAWPQVSRAVSATLDVPAVPDADVFGRLSRFRRKQTELVKR
jgi:peptide/nickel transport system substrate-binding protein